jgi:hypothetical protein
MYAVDRRLSTITSRWEGSSDRNQNLTQVVVTKYERGYRDSVREVCDSLLYEVFRLLPVGATGLSI